MPETKTAKMRKATPPPSREPGYNWPKIAKKLRASPGEWFEIYKQDKTGYAVSIRNGDTSALRPSDGFEVRTANNTRGRPASAGQPAEPRMCTLFLRWVPTTEKGSTV